MHNLSISSIKIESGFELNWIIIVKLSPNERLLFIYLNTLYRTGI